MKKRSSNRFVAQMVLAMVIYGTIGLFVRGIALPSGLIALSRGVTGSVFVALVMLLKKEKPSLALLKKNAVRLLLSGAALGFNWVFLFEAYRYTSVAAATLCYYMAPVFIFLASPFLFKEKVTAKKCIGVCVAVMGMIPVSGVLKAGFSVRELRGILLGLAAAVLYSAIVILNKKLTGLGAYPRTLCQLLISSAVMSVYVFLVEKPAALSPGVKGTVLLLIVGIVHTGLAYVLYFGSVKELKAQTSALLSYIDPVVAVLCSAVLLSEGLDIPGCVGAVMILGSAVFLSRE